MADPVSLALMGTVIAAGSLVGQTVQSLQSSGDMNRNRNIIITVANHMPKPEKTNIPETQRRSIREGEHYCSSGKKRIHTAPSILPGTKDAMGFSKKTEHTARGVNGVQKFELTNTAGERVWLYIGFNVPYSGTNEFSLELHNHSFPAKDAYYHFDRFKANFDWGHHAFKQAGDGVGLNVKGHGFKVEATMGNNGNEEMKVDVWPL